jgi:hypothetical protein
MIEKKMLAFLLFPALSMLSGEHIAFAQIQYGPTVPGCTLTGPDSGANNDIGSNDQVEGTDLGSIFDDGIKKYFVFGDTNLTRTWPAEAEYSNAIATTQDNNPDDCIDIRFMTITDIFPDMADFYARESNLQALNAGCRNCTTVGCCAADQYIFNSYSDHNDWAIGLINTSGNALDIIANELTRKAERVFTWLLQTGGMEAVAQYYARLSVRYNNYGIPFHALTPATKARNSTLFEDHKQWATQRTISEITNETRIRQRELLTAISERRVKQIFASKTSVAEETAIPTNGISLVNSAGERKYYIFFMSVKIWGKPGEWETNYSGIAESDDGVIYRRHDNLFSDDSNFAQVSLVLKDDYLYLFGIPAGRFGGVKLARVHRDSVLNVNEYRYWNGADWSTTDENQAVQIVQAPVGELSVQYHPGAGRWLMAYMHEAMPDSNPPELQAIVATESVDMIHWSNEQPLMDCTDSSYATCYGGFMHPAYYRYDRIYYIASFFWDRYNVEIMSNSIAYSPLPDLTVSLTDDGPACKRVFVTNNSYLPLDWTVSFEFAPAITRHWNVNLVQSGTTVTIEGMDWNNILQPGETTHSIGFCLD